VYFSLKKKNDISYFGKLKEKEVFIYHRQQWDLFHSVTETTSPQHKTTRVKGNRALQIQKFGRKLTTQKVGRKLTTF
jgi:hypothetical protein